MEAISNLIKLTWRNCLQRYTDIQRFLFHCQGCLFYYFTSLFQTVNSIAFIVFLINRTAFERSQTNIRVLLNNREKSHIIILILTAQIHLQSQWICACDCLFWITTCFRFFFFFFVGLEFIIKDFLPFRFRKWDQRIYIQVLIFKCFFR